MYLLGLIQHPKKIFYRVMKIKEFGIDPFVMPFDKSNKYQNRFARWCNHKAVLM